MLSSLWLHSQGRLGSYSMIELFFSTRLLVNGTQPNLQCGFGGRSPVLTPPTTLHACQTLAACTQLRAVPKL